MLGCRGEDVAARWYATAGYRILDRNWRCPTGELDLVALDPSGTTVVVCEVKSRSSTAFGHPGEAVTAAKQIRLRRLAGRWLATRGPGPSTARAVRFDVAAVIDDGARGPVLEMFHDAF
ncbi:MAG: YraN family protein [Acidimicrobiales bacterium]